MLRSNEHTNACNRAFFSETSFQKCFPKTNRDFSFALFFYWFIEINRFTSIKCILMRVQLVGFSSIFKFFRWFKEPY